MLGPRVPAGSNLGPLDWSLNLGPMAAGLYFFSARYQREWPLGLQGWGLAGSKVAWPGVRGQEGQVLGAGGQAALLGTGGGSGAKGDGEGGRLGWQEGNSRVAEAGVQGDPRALEAQASGTCVQGCGSKRVTGEAGPEARVSGGRGRRGPEARGLGN